MKTKQAPGVSRQVVEPGKMFGKNPMAGNKKTGLSDGKPAKPVPKGKASLAHKLDGKRI